MAKTKKCTCCKKIKPLSEFHKQKAYKDGYRSQCKKCLRKKDKHRYNNDPEVIKKRKEKEAQKKLFQQHLKKRCACCKKIKLLSAFSKNSATKDGYQYLCKKCTSEKDKRRYNNDPEVIAKRKEKEVRKELFQYSKKYCTYCKQIKPLSAFRKDSRTKDGYRYWCKECVNTYQQTPKCRERRRNGAKIYYKTHKNNCSTLRRLAKAYFKELGLDPKNVSEEFLLLKAEHIRLRRQLKSKEKKNGSSKTGVKRG